MLYISWDIEDFLAPKHECILVYDKSQCALCAKKNFFAALRKVLLATFQCVEKCETKWHKIGIVFFYSSILNISLLHYQNKIDFNRENQSQKLFTWFSKVFEQAKHKEIDR